MKNFEEIKKKAENGDTQSQYDLGIMYATGNGVRHHEEKAIEWLSKAAEGGHPEAHEWLKKCKSLRSLNIFLFVIIGVIAISIVWFIRWIS